MIYAIVEVGEQTAVKIGHTSTHGRASVRLAETRLSQLQVGNPRELKVIAFAVGDASHEAELHARFYEQRIRGEWFRLIGPVLDWVNGHAVGRKSFREIAEENAEQRRLRNKEHEQQRLAEVRQAALRIRLPRMPRVVDVNPYDVVMERLGRR